MVGGAALLLALVVILMWALVADSELSAAPRRGVEQIRMKASPIKSSSAVKSILYIVTSSLEYNWRQEIRGMSHHPKDRLMSLVIPVMKDSIESMRSAGFHVDAYLILGYKLRPQREKLVRLHLVGKSSSSLSLEIWDDATPFNYNDDMIRHKHKVPDHVSVIDRALSRQHRLVVRDKLFDYDMFVAFEDDMLVTGEHVKHYLHMSQRIDALRSKAPIDGNPEKWYGNMSRRQISRLRPGFLRVEVLQRELAQHRNDSKVGVGFTEPTGDPDRVAENVDASICCPTYHVVNGAGARMFSTNHTQLIIWETSIDGITVRELPDGSWVGLLMSGGVNDTTIASFSSDAAVQRLPNDPKLVAQSAGWMMTRRQILELQVDLCHSSSFLPPFHELQSDGLWMMSTEYWSGGIQMWLDGCNVQRVISLDDPKNFSKHLLYHTSNNKQRVVAPRRQVDANLLLRQLSDLRKNAARRKREVGRVF